MCAGSPTFATRLSKSVGSSTTLPRKPRIGWMQWAAGGNITVPTIDCTSTTHTMPKRWETFSHTHHSKQDNHNLNYAIFLANDAHAPGDERCRGSAMDVSHAISTPGI